MNHLKKFAVNKVLIHPMRGERHDDRYLQVRCGPPGSHPIAAVSFIDEDAFLET